MLPIQSIYRDFSSLVQSSHSTRLSLTKRWGKRWEEGDSRFHRLLPCPTNTDLPHKALVKLNRIRSSVGRFKAQLHQWGLADSGCCDCGTLRTADHFISDCPPLPSPAQRKGPSRPRPRNEAIVSRIWRSHYDAKVRHTQEEEG